MNRTLVTQVAMVVVAGISLICSAAAQATTIAEWDFRVDEDLTIAANGASTNTTLLNLASVNTGAAVPGSLTTNPKLLNGLLNTTGGSGNRADRTDATWNQLYGTSNLTSGSFAIVFKPGFTSGRHAIISQKAVSGSNGQVWAYIENNGSNFDVNLRVGQDAAQAYMLLPITTNDWYFWAGSWTPGGKTFSYLRDITSGAAANSVLGTTNVAMNSLMMNSAIFLGLRSDNTAESAASQFAFAQLTDQYVGTAAGWNAIYNNLLTPTPEPSSIVLTSLGCAMLFARRRRRQRMMISDCKKS